MKLRRTPLAGFLQDVNGKWSATELTQTLNLSFGPNVEKCIQFEENKILRQLECVFLSLADELHQVSQAIGYMEA